MAQTLPGISCGLRAARRGVQAGQWHVSFSSPSNSEKSFGCCRVQPCCFTRPFSPSLLPLFQALRALPWELNPNSRRWRIHLRRRRGKGLNKGMGVDGNGDCFRDMGMPFCMGRRMKLLPGHGGGWWVWKGNQKGLNIEASVGERLQPTWVQSCSRSEPRIATLMGPTLQPR